MSSSQTSWLELSRLTVNQDNKKTKLETAKIGLYLKYKVLEVHNTLWKLIMYCMIDKIAKRLLEDQNLKRRNISSLGSHPSWVNLFSFFLEHWNMNYFTQEVRLLSSYSANAFLESWARPNWLLLLFFCLKRLSKSSQKFLVCWDSWQDLNPSDSN